MSTAQKEYVEKTPDGAYRIAGTRVSLDSIVHGYWQGQSPEAIVDEFPTLTLEQVYGALAYYLREREIVDAYLDAQGERWEEVRRQSEANCGALLDRLRTAAKPTIREVVEE